MSSSAPSARSPSSANSAKELANIVYPSVLRFFVNDARTHSQTIQVANPFDVRVKFKVLSTAPRKYKVSKPEGFLQPNSQVDL